MAKTPRLAEKERSEMRIVSGIVSLVVLVALAACDLSAAPAVTPVPPPPAPGGIARGVFAVQVGPGDSTGVARKMRGKMNIIAVPPPSVQPKSVELSMDGKSIGRCPASPFKIEFNTVTAPDGEHVIKAVGRDAAGKEVWTASLKVEIVNSKKPPSEGFASRPGAGTTPPPRPAGLSPRGNPDKPTKTAKPDKSAKRKKPTDASSVAMPAGLSLDRTYSNEHYGFSIKYPGSWTFKDQTVTMKPKSDSDFWLAFGTYPIEKASLVVNVRRVKLEAGADAERFATYNPYVKKWESKTVLGSPAFATTSRVLRPKPSVIHRLIVIKDGQAWMLNCTDYVGKSPEERLGLLDGMVATITSSAQAQ